MCPPVENFWRRKGCFENNRIVISGVKTLHKIINRKLLQIFDLMYSKCGPRHWWPAETRLEVIVGAILTQFVSWKNVTAAIDNLKNENILSVEGICGADIEKLESLIRCTRFYKQKAKKLKSFCFHLKDKYGGSLDRMFDQDVESLRNELLSLYGIGEETADCIILYAAYKPIFVVDAYTRRIFSRLGLVEENASYKEIQMFFMENLDKDVRLYNEYHAQIDGIGNNYCSSKSPKCAECPLNTVCKGAAGGLSGT